MPVVDHAKVSEEPFRTGATYQTLVGDSQGSTPVRIGIQLSLPGYETPKHFHPYMEVITVLEGSGEAWLESSKELVSLRPGITLVIPPNVPHWFRASGDTPLKTYGVHASPVRISTDLAE